MDTLYNVADRLFSQSLTFIVLFAVFGALARLWPMKAGQKMWRADIWTDLGYWFLVPFFVYICNTLFIGLYYMALFGDDQAAVARAFDSGYGPIARLPDWLQIVLFVVIGDVGQYWMHRWMHQFPFLWKFHAIHHAPQELDWLSHVRFHPVNVFLFMVMSSYLPLMLGLAAKYILLLATFNLIYSSMVHANVKWHFGPLNMWFSSPIYHRWHHADDPEAIDKNFAPTFPFIDRLFGSYYMPKDKRPDVLGIKEDVPRNLGGQLMYPFKKK